ncbi:THO complex subunit 6 isoform X6 [Brachypodium distachyon]|uniref:THO complex subunit 6 isoform X6 n=1 Tax=Brachypodium distachyon TaxID=15368 RepID=UPI000D0D3A46|nr:THO complex subunit 6 isoform X6 [Brachypodium distachyon]|eukprot:XP_024319265.1 THO complex subunit 6 isoform X6 [Brachypodium distachyon]
MATATATAQAQAQPAMDAREWDEAAYRRGILRERDLSCRTLFRAVFFDQRDDPDPDVLLAAASSDGSLASFSLSSCISSSAPTHAAPQPVAAALVDPVCIVQAHSGPAYDVKFYNDPLQPLLFSCGDDGRIRGWRWHEMQSCLVPLSLQGDHLEPVLDLVNPQHEGPWGARSPIPENNAIAISKQDGSVFAAAGDACAYCWDVESGKCKMTFKGHTDYLHSIAVREANHQIAEVGSVHRRYIQYRTRNLRARGLVALPLMRVKVGWPVVLLVVYQFGVFFQMSASLTQIVVLLFKICCLIKIKLIVLPLFPFSSTSIQILAVGAEPALSRFTINGAVLSQIKCAPPSAFSVSMHSSGMAAVAGHGGLVDVISAFGSHLCAFRCRGLDK